jgi:predicted ATPase with chaperone activity
MSLAVVHSRALIGIDAIAVRVEVHISGGLPSMSIVGLPEAAVKESKVRVRAALQNFLFEFPARRITAILAPADLPKDGGWFDLPIALGILAASEQLSSDKLPRNEFIGELALGGGLHAVRGALPTAIASRRSRRAQVRTDIEQMHGATHLAVVGQWGMRPFHALHHTASAVALVGNIDDAQATLQPALGEKPDLSITYLQKTLPTKFEGGLNTYLNGLRKAGLPE